MQYEITDKKIEHLYHNANAEFWLQLDDGLAERFGEMVMEYLAEVCEDKDKIKFVLKDYGQWKEDHPEAI